MKRNRKAGLFALLMAAALPQARLYAEPQAAPLQTECGGSRTCLQTPALTPEAQEAMELILQQTVDEAVREALRAQQEALREQSEAQMTALRKSRAFWLKAALVEAALLGAGTYLALRTR